MNKVDAINKVVEKVRIDNEVVEVIVNNFIEVICASIKDGEKVVLEDFGTFAIKEVAASVGRHPVTKEEIILSSKNELEFRASIVLKKMINNT
ncbi:HU family DNA-binding protein [Paenibacillus sp. PL2-23]|uniref:HU family DNA-binding protein n=1 Tax=Paenibacillus sp. PL2-23 TaxID=2100729 RepID=UPI0030FD1F4E